jgi:hypothetical protein
VNVAAIETDGELVFSVSMCRNPAKLAGMSRSRGVLAVSDDHPVTIGEATSS